MRADDLGEFVKGHSMTSEEIRSFIVEGGRAIHEAHTKYGILHRDVKPPNFFVSALFHQS